MPERVILSNMLSLAFEETWMTDIFDFSPILTGI